MNNSINDLNIRIAGEAGQGLVSVGDLLAGALLKSGLHVLATQSYMSRIRGGLNWVDLRIGDREIFAPREKADLLVALSDEALKCLKDDMTDHGVVIYNGKCEADSETVCFDFLKTAKGAGAAAVMANAVAAGAVFAALDCDLEILNKYLQDEFARKGEEVVQKNIVCARAGFDILSEKHVTLKAPEANAKPYGKLLSGASAVALAAASAGVKFATAYPMSPATATFTQLARLADEYGIVVEQAEDEIAAVNMVCGATYAGAIAMTSTSGGGFALMVEGVSLAGMTELPLFIMLGQRPGPATGLPTRTAQEDLNFAVFAGHGEFPKAVFAPGTQRQCLDVTRHAIAAAQKFQTPVILLTDQFLQDAMKNIEFADVKYAPVDRCLAADAGENYHRYEITPDGVSPRAIPGGDALVICDSDEHDAEGHITEDLQIRIAMQQKRMKKLDGLVAASLPPELCGKKNAEIMLVCWGSTYGAVREAVDILNENGRAAAMLHFSQVWPLDIGRINDMLAPAQRVIVVEGNYTGQFASQLRAAGCNKKLETLNRYDGLPFTTEYILSKMEG